MRRFLANPTARGLAIVAAIALVIVLLSLEATLAALYLLASIAFFLAIAFFVYLVWRERRSEIAEWSTRSRAAFYGAALLAVVDVGAFVVYGAVGLDALAFVLVLAASVFAMVRVWRDEHRYTS